MKTLFTCLDTSGFSSQIYGFFLKKSNKISFFSKPQKTVSSCQENDTYTRIKAQNWSALGYMKRISLGGLTYIRSLQRSVSRPLAIWIWQTQDRYKKRIVCSWGGTSSITLENGGDLFRSPPPASSCDGGVVNGNTLRPPFIVISLSVPSIPL